MTATLTRRAGLAAARAVALIALFLGLALALAHFSMARAGEPFLGECEPPPGEAAPSALIIDGFATDSARPTVADEAAIATYARNLGRFDEICVIGQADKRGPVAYNDHLAMRRAKAVAARLVAAGVAPEKLRLSSRAEAYGDSFPDWFWFAGSRRVEVQPIR